MIILFGTRQRRTSLGVVMLLCQHCQRPSAHAVFRVRSWFTLFFIPLFPISTKYGTACPMCGAGTRIDRTQAEHLESVAAQQTTAPVEMTPDGPISPYPVAEAPAMVQLPVQPGADSEESRTVPTSPSTDSSPGGPPGPGWWRASDEKWYPPELHPDAR